MVQSITLYLGFCKHESTVRKLFQLMQGFGAGVVSWTWIISGFVQNFRYRDACNTFKNLLVTIVVSCLLVVVLADLVFLPFLKF